MPSAGYGVDRFHFVNTHICTIHNVLFSCNHVYLKFQCDCVCYNITLLWAKSENDNYFEWQQLRIKKPLGKT